MYINVFLMNTLLDVVESIKFKNNCVSLLKEELSRYEKYQLYLIENI